MPEFIYPPTIPIMRELVCPPTIPIMEGLYRYYKNCPWIQPCPVCGAVCVLTVESESKSDPTLRITVDYACLRKH
jgi:hypothetical protein